MSRFLEASRRRSLFLVVLLAALAIALTAGAQSKSDPAALAREADVLIADLQARNEGLAALYEKVLSAEGERRAIYRGELVRRWDDYARQLDRLVENLVRQRQVGVAQESQLEAARKLTTAVANGLSDDVLSRLDSLTKTEDERAAASGEGVALLTRKARREAAVYHGVLTSIVDNVERMRKLGLASGAEGEQVDRLLQDRAELLSGRLRLQVLRQDEVRALLRSAHDEEKVDLQKEKIRVDELMRATAEGLKVVLDQMDRRNLETSELRETLLLATKDLGPGTLDTKVAVGLAQQWMHESKVWLKDNGRQIWAKAVVVLAILLVFFVLSRMAGRVVRVAVRIARLDVSKLLQEFFVTMTQRIILGIGVLVAFGQFGLDLAPLLAGLGIAGFIVGFALQDTLSNFASGMMILVYRPYDVGDAVEVSGVLGVVSEMSLVSTTIKTFDNQRLIVPNSKIWGNVIRNLTAEDTRRVDLVFSISYGDDIAKAERLLREEVEKHELVLREPEAVIRVNALGESSVDFIVRPWVKTIDYWTVYWDLTKNVKLRFDAEGITIPFPQRHVMVHKAD